MSQRERLIEMEVEGWPEPLQMVYHGLIAAGESVVMAHMLASRSAPTMGLNSDRQFTSSHHRHMSSMSKDNIEGIVELAQKAGISTHGKYYVSGLGKYTDPHAWCATADDVKRACIAKNLSASGPGIEHKAPEPPPKKKVPLAPDLVHRYKQKYKAENPALAEKCKKSPKVDAELTERVIERHGKKKD